MLSSLDIVRTRNAIESTALGKKVFSLYPPPVLSEVAEELARNEYEIYLIHDHRKLRRVLPSNGESVLFVNIDESPEGTNWESYIGEIMCDSGCKDVGVGILTMNTIEPPIRERYLTKLKIPCGSVMLRFGMSKNIEILTKTLEACKARGNRRYVRALCPPGSGRCNVEFDGSTIYGDILDISSAGMAVTFEHGGSLRQGTVLRKLSILIKGVRLIADGFVAKERPGEDGLTVHIVMFLPNSLDERRSEKLKLLVYKLNQYTMNRCLDSMN